MGQIFLLFGTAMASKSPRHRVARTRSPLSYYSSKGDAVAEYDAGARSPGNTELIARPGFSYADRISYWPSSEFITSAARLVPASSVSHHALARLLKSSSTR
jgi:hypothetical protein